MRTLILLAAAATAVPAAAHAGPLYHYRLDGGHSAVSAKVSFFGIAAKTAQFPDKQGQLAIDPGRIEQLALDVTVDARTLIAGDMITRDRLRGPRFFDIAHYPQIHFDGRKMAMTGDRTAVLTGEITARGVTRPAQLNIVFASPPRGSDGHNPIVLNATVTINRDDFGMTAYHFIVGRNVTITINATMVPV